MRAIWILVLCIHGIVLSAQDIQFSRHYAGGSKRVPLQILNEHADYFYVLRYNREIHDLIIEKRGKPSSELLHIYPLQLDSINAHWFDYEKLDYLFFEKDQQVFFVFEKVLNNQSTLYMKVLSDQGKLSHFIPILTEQRNNSKSLLTHEFKLTEEKHLQILSELSFFGSGTRKSIYLYDPLTKVMLWQKKLPIENAFTGYSNGHLALEDGRLYYTIAYDRIIDYQRIYSTTGQSQIPVFLTDTVKLFLLDQQSLLHSIKLPCTNMTGLHSAFIIATKKNVYCAIPYQQSDTMIVPLQFLVCNWSADLSSWGFVQQTSMERNLLDKLRYFDGSDLVEAEAKRFRHMGNTRIEDQVIIWEERRDENYYKELLVWSFDLQNGKITEQVLLPRKLFFFPQRTNYRQLGEVALLQGQDGTSCFLLENRGNLKMQAADYDHRNFAKQTQLKHGALVQYQIENGAVKKRLLFENDDFDFIPLKYTGWSKDFVFFLSKNRVEKFAILKDCPF